MKQINRQMQCNAGLTKTWNKYYDEYINDIRVIVPLNADLLFSNNNSTMA